MYGYLGMKYESPTAGLVIPPDDFVKFCKGFEGYIKLPVEPMNVDEARHQKLFRKLNEVHGDLVYGKVGDIEICFLHYPTFEEAKEKWERRTKRVDLKRVIYKNDDNNYMSDEDFEAWNEFASSSNSYFVTCHKELVDRSKAKITRLTDYVLPDFPDWVASLEGSRRGTARLINRLLK